MALSEIKMKIVMENYFKAECDVNTSIKGAFEKGFNIGVQKGMELPKENQGNSESRTTNKDFMNTLDTNHFEAAMHALYFNPSLWVQGTDAQKHSTPNIFAVRGWLDATFNKDSEFWKFIFEEE